MDNSYSGNWAFLLKLLNNYSENSLQGNSNFSAHQQAYAFALFLADATLATPELNRSNVADLISGKLSWPCTSSRTAFQETKYTLEFFEDGGFISFPGGWVNVHCSEPKQASSLDQSIEDILRVTALLKNISYGWNGYVQTHFVIKETKLAALFSTEMGLVELDRILPSAVQQGENVALYPERHQFTQLESTYLWQRLLKRHSAELAFQQWMLCVRAMSHSIIPVQFSLLEENETAQFLCQVELLVETSPEFGYSLRTIYKQSINSHDFGHLIQPTLLNININIASDGNILDKTDDSREPSTLTPMTVENLDDAYNIPDIDDAADIFSFGQWQHWGNWHDSMGALSWIINSCFNHVISIDHNSLSSKSFALNLIALAESRQALKHLLLMSFPLRINSKYLLFLLSRPQTCEVAIYHLISGENFSHFSRRHNMTGDIGQLYTESLLEEYIRTIDDRTHSRLKLLNLFLYLADNSGLYTLINNDNFHYRALSCLMHKLEDKHVVATAYAFLEKVSLQYEQRISQIRERSVYQLGLWLIQRIESIDATYHDLLPQLSECLLSFYSNAFKECIAIRSRDLKSDNFFALLPWQSLIKVIGIKEILRLSRRYDNWASVLTYNHDRCFNAASAIRQYLQLLMLISKDIPDQDDRSRVWQRIINIVCALGFGHEDERCYLFTAIIDDEAVELWKVFSLFVNILPKSMYDDFTESCIDMVPIDSLYILLERCNIQERKQVLHDAILDRQNLSDEKLGLKSLETAFVHACENGHMELAEKVLIAAEPLLDRFRSYSNIHFKDTVYRWETYRYKYKLLSAYLKDQDNPHGFEEVVLHVPLPSCLTGLSGSEIVNRQLKECEQFRRYIIATAFCQIEPTKTVRYMEALCAEVSAPHFAYALLKGKIAELSDKQNKSARLHALNKFLEQTSSITPDQMAASWVATVLDLMIQVGDHLRTDEYWRKLTGEQHRTREILLPYCKGLIQRGEPLVASQIINEFRKFNHILSEYDVGLAELITQLSQALPEQNSILDIINAMAESNQRSIEQLKQHYLRIVGGSFDDYVQITGDGPSKELFLKKIITDVAGEVLLRKKNLQSQQTTSGQLNKTINEDLINDWFTSLIDMRMAEARVGFRDQKRSGTSESGKSPGESDGLITDSKNRRIAIFEAFRLSSLNKNVISDHLNKVSGYDLEALSPIFMVAYCDVKDFSTLTKGYHSLISEIDYTGYKKSAQVVEIDEETITDNLWVCTETRLRGEREILFCHFLLNMYCN